jgi:hypothetical protein
MGGARFNDLAHEAGILQNVQCFLVTFPIFRTHYNEISSAAMGYAQRGVVANWLFYKGF